VHICGDAARFARSGPLLGALFLTVAWSAQVKLAKLAPLIGALQSTDERITQADVRRGMVRSMSTRAPSHLASQYDIMVVGGGRGL